MASRLDNIIRLRKWELDEQRRLLADLQAEEAAIEERIDGLDIEVSLQMAARQGEVSTLTLGAYLEGARERKRQFIENLATKRLEIEEQQAKVSETFQDLKTFEIAREHELKRIADAEARQEQAEFDELGIRRHSQDREEALERSEREESEEA